GVLNCQEYPKLPALVDASNVDVVSAPEDVVRTNIITDFVALTIALCLTFRQIFVCDAAIADAYIVSPGYGIVMKKQTTKNPVRLTQRPFLVQK
ncbi:unnamed protein product, partial [Cylicostephanus goldi]